MDARKLGQAFVLLWAGCNCGPDVASQTREGGGDGGGTVLPEGSSGPVDPSTTGTLSTSSEGSSSGAPGTTMSIDPGSTTTGPPEGSSSSTAEGSSSTGEGSSSTGEPGSSDTWAIEIAGSCDVQNLLPDGVLCWRLSGSYSIRPITKVDRITGQLAAEFGDGGVIEVPVSDVATRSDVLFVASNGSGGQPPVLSRLDPTTAATMYEFERPYTPGPYANGHASVALNDDTVFVLDHSIEADGEIRIRGYQIDDGTFVRDYSFGDVSDVVAQLGAGGEVIVNGHTITAVINPEGGPWGNAENLRFRRFDALTGDLLTEHITELDYYLRDAVPRGDSMLWWGTNPFTDAFAFTDAFDSFALAPDDFEPALTTIRTITAHGDYLYVSGRRDLDEGGYIWRIERRLIETGELDLIFGTDGAIEGGPGEYWGHALADDDALFVSRPAPPNDDGYVTRIERRSLPSGSL